MIPASPTDHMELREGSNEDEDFEECVEELIPTLEEDHMVPNTEDLLIEEVDLEDNNHGSDIPHSKHIKKSNSEEDEGPHYPQHRDQGVQNPSFHDCESDVKESEGFTSDRNAMSQ